MRFGRSPWFVSAIGGAFAPNAAFLPVLCAMVSGSMGRCTSSNRYGDAIDTDRVPAVRGWEGPAGRVRYPLLGERRTTTRMHRRARSAPPGVGVRSGGDALGGAE